MLNHCCRRGASSVSLLFLAAATAAAAPGISDAEALVSQGRFEQALEELEAAPSRNARWHLLASRIFDGLKDPVRAAGEAQEAVDLDPGSEAHHLQLGQILLTHNNADGAHEVFSTALQRFPDSDLLRVGNGLALNRLQQHEDAEAEFREVLTRRPTLGIALDGLVEARLHLVRYEEAANAADRFMAASPVDYRGYYYAGLVKQRTGAPPEDVEGLVRQAIDRNERFAPAHALLGQVLLMQGRLEEAALTLEGAIVLRPDYVLGHMHLARAYGRLGRRQDSERHMRRVRELERAQREAAPVLRRRPENP